MAKDKNWESTLKDYLERAQKKQHISDKLLIGVIAANKRKATDPEWLAKNAANNANSDVKAKRRASMPDQSGENNPFYGKQHSAKTKKSISNKKKGQPAANKGTNHTKATLKKMRKPRSEEGKANMRGPRQQKTCPHCGFVGAGGNMTRYHFDNCKSLKG